ncbi:MAG: BLUF domain-containing protein [Thiotrichales bacterium]
MTQQAAPLIRCIYASGATKYFYKERLLELLKKAREKNVARGITGVLLFHKHSFFQVLEGEREVVRQLFAEIATDPRHARVTLIVEEAIPHRSFGSWTMGYAEISDVDINKIPGLNDFFTEGRSFADLEPGRVHKLLDAFREGQWHIAAGREVLMA